MAESPGESGSLPQLAMTLLEPAIEAIRTADLSEPVDSWLKKWIHKAKCNEKTGPLKDEQIRQVRSLLLFLGVLSSETPQRLAGEVATWRSDRRRLVAALTESFRRGYAAAGCDPKHADLIGAPKLGDVALRRVLAEEAPFRNLAEKKSGAVDNALRFAMHVHRRIADDELVPRQWPDDEPGDVPEKPSGTGDSFSAPAYSGPLHDWGTIASPKRYRLQRIDGDRWIYGIVHFESPVGVTDSTWGSHFEAPHEARLLEQLAAALLDEADSAGQKLLPAPAGSSRRSART